MTEDGTTPTITVLAGNPTETELAIVISLMTQVTPTEVVQPNPPSRWSNRAAQIRPVVSPGPGAWRASAFPG